MARRRRRHDRRRAAHRQRVARARAHRLRAQRVLRAAARRTARRTSTRRARCPTRGSSRAPTTRSTRSGPRSSTAPTARSGQGVWRFYRARGFTFPGRPESAPPTLAQHDWIHVLADYGSTVESEIEVFGLISRANDDPHGVLAARDGARPVRDRLPLRRGARASSGTTAATSRVTSTAWRSRLADAMYRGAMLACAPQRHRPPRRRPTSSPPTGSRTPTVRSTTCAPTSGSRPVRTVPSPPARRPPWEPGGISPYQYAHGRDGRRGRGTRVRVVRRRTRLNPRTYDDWNPRIGAPGRTRTCDLVIRSDLLCPAELRRQRGAKSIFRSWGFRHDVDVPDDSDTRAPRNATSSAAVTTSSHAL